MIKKLQVLVNKKINNEPEESKKRRFLIIKNLLQEENLFFQINIEDAISILMDLDFTKEESIDIYKQLIDSTNYHDTN